MSKIKNIDKKVEKFLIMKKPSKETLEKINEIINYCSNLYYDGDEESPLTDEYFDKLVNHYSKFAKAPKAIDISKGKRNKNLVDTEHLFPQLVGTLYKTNYVTNKEREEAKNLDTETVEDWFKTSSLDKNKIYKFFLSWKLDGNSITIVWNDKKEVVMALTRGKNGLGSDKTSYFKNRKLPSWIKVPKGENIGIKFEAITSFDNKIKMEEKLGKEYASPCSLVSGLLSKNDIDQEIIDMIDLAPIRVQYSKTKLSRLEEIDLISKLNSESDLFPISIKPIISSGKDNDYKIEGTKESKTSFDKNISVLTYPEMIKNISKVYKLFSENIRESLPYPVDGVVIEVLDEDVRKELTRKEGEDKNKFEFALKFPYDTKKSYVEDIEFYVSTNGTGRITPVVRFTPVKFSRAICDHVSIANYDRFRKLKLAKGDEVIISYRNDVLAYLTRDENKEHVGKPIKFISRCPMCGEKLKVNANKTFVSCVNKKCPSIKIGRINNYLIKLGIDSVRENTLRDLYNEGLLTGISSLYKLKVSDIEKIEGYQKKSAQNIVDSINSKKEFFDYELLGALGFKGISTTTCKLICKVFTINELIECINDEFDDLSLKLIDINGIANKTASQFEKDFKKSIKLINKLKNYLTIKDFKNNITTTSEPKNIVFTGFRDADMQNKLEMVGHSIKSSVSKKTNILVTISKGSGTVKEKKAIEYGIDIYSLDEFKEKILDTLI